MKKLNIKGMEKVYNNKFWYSKYTKEEEPTQQVLGAGKIGCCRYQNIKNITNWLGLVKEEDN